MSEFSFASPCDLAQRFLCSLGYHRYRLSAMAVRYIRNEGKHWVYEAHMYCSICGKFNKDIFSVPKPIKESNDDGT